MRALNYLFVTYTSNIKCYAMQHATVNWQKQKEKDIKAKRLM